MKLLLSLFVMASVAGYAQEQTTTETETRTMETPQGETITQVEEVEQEEDNDGSLILSVAGVVNDRVKEVENDNDDNELNVGGAILVEANINDHLGIETGGILINRQYERGGDNIRVIQEVKRLHVPVLVRFWPVDFISIGAGGFAAFKVGDVKNSLEIGDTEVASISTSADDSVEYGLEGALTLNLAVSDKTGIFVEGRYSELLSGDSNDDFNEVSGLAGVKIDL